MALTTMFCFSVLALALVSAAPAPGSGTNNSTDTEERSGALGAYVNTTDQTHNFNFNCNNDFPRLRFGITANSPAGAEIIRKSFVSIGMIKAWVFMNV